MPVPREEYVFFASDCYWILKLFSRCGMFGISCYCMSYVVYFFFHHNDWLINCCLLTSEYYFIIIQWTYVLHLLFHILFKTTIQSIIYRPFIDQFALNLQSRTKIVLKFFFILFKYFNFLI